MKNEILESLDILNNNADYWFVRTDGGLYFDTFFTNEFIAIGWDDITLADLVKPEAEVKSKIARIYKLDLKIRADKTKATDIYNKLRRFISLRENDVIVIPSQNSDYLAFGIVMDNLAYEDLDEKHDCPFKKRRNVKWFSKNEFGSLDDVFYKIRKSRHAISNVNDYADHIDSVMYTVYQKEDISHFVVRVRQHHNINWYNLASTLIEMHELMSEINVEFGLNEDVENSSIQIALQSPGLFNLSQKGLAIILLATTLGAASCSEIKGRLPVRDREKLEQIEERNADEVESLKAKLDTMGVIL